MKPLWNIELNDYGDQEVISYTYITVVGDELILLLYPTETLTYSLLNTACSLLL